MGKNEFLLEMIGIDKQFPGVKALDDVTIKVRPHSVHALMGENGAGKSTLMKCLFGIYSKDAGEIKLEGETVNFKNSKDALENGVSMVHQELNQVQSTRVLDNIWLGRFPKKKFFIDEAKMYNETLEIFNDLGIDIDPRKKIEDLTVSQAQMVEIAKAVSHGSKVLIMDEPTSSLSSKEVNHLFEIINKLRDDGVGIIYISHKMDEIKKIADEVTIMRDGKFIDNRAIEDVTIDEIINLMVGRELKDRFPPKTHEPKELLLEVKNLTAVNKKSIKDVSFDLRKGEVLGVAGLVGSKRTDLLECLFGDRRIEEGEIYLHGKKIDNSTPKKAINNGFAMVTEERRATGIFSELNITFNATIANIDDYVKYGLLESSRINKDVNWVVDSMSVKTPGNSTKIKSLSGGNQQKVIIGRWMLTEPDIFLMDEPTRGIDVGAKYEIYKLMDNLAKKDKGVIMVSSEMAELIGVADRIVVMSAGRLAGILEKEDFSQEEIMRLSAMYL